MMSVFIEEARSQPGVPASEVLSVNGIVKDFGGQRALDGVSISLRAGEIHALVGQNGAGKSTLIKILTGVYSPTAGEIRVNGRHMTIATPHDATMAGIAVVHQQGNLIPTLSIQENLFLGQSLPRLGQVFVDWPAVRQRAKNQLARVGLDLDPSRLISSLRADEIAMVSIAKAISTDAQVIILDEPTTALVPDEVEVLFAQMRRLAGEGHSFVFVSHRMSEIFEVATSATVLRDGKVAWSSVKSGRLSSAEVIPAILGKSDNLATNRDRTVARTADGTSRIEVRNLRAQNITSCSFAAGPGEILGLAGLPSSGAEETLDALYGRTRSAADLIRLDGRSLRLSSPRDAVQAGIAFVPKDRPGEAVLQNFTVSQNITIAALGRLITDPLSRYINKTRERRMARDLVSRLNVKTAGLDAPIRSLSGGNQQKCVLARWIATDARLYLLNSPTAAVDIGAKAEIYKLLQRIAAEGATILFTSTEFDEFARVCDRVLVFSKGRITGELAGPSISEKNILHMALADFETAQSLAGSASDQGERA